MDTKEKIGAKDCIHLANDIIVTRNLLIPRLTSLKDINYSFFLMVFNDIFILDSDLMSIHPKNAYQETKLLELLLTYVSKELLHISLDHIKAEDIVRRDVNPIHDLLEIIMTFIQYIPQKFAKNDNISNELKVDSKAVQTNH